ncbi:MAG: hypothetical protein M3018_03265 [Actinomycetota bacterium]|nr:hypothetical protein [Actinomycetota bacterium]
MSALTAFIAELRERRLWPVVVVLLAGIVAVPVVLAKGAAPTSTPSPPPSGLPVSSNPGKPSVSLARTPTAIPPHGPGRDPFTPLFGTAAQAFTSTPSIPSSSPGSASPGVSTASGGGGGNGSAPLGPVTPTTTPPTTTTTPTTPPTPTTTPTDSGPAPAPDPAPTGLTATEAYHITLAITNRGGGLDTISPLERLSVLPSRRHPLLVELGVSRGGRRVLFAVQPGAVVKGPGQCTPGPIDCQILSLRRGQTETLSSADGAVSHVLLAVTAVTTGHYPSAAAARKARRTASAQGRKLLRGSTLSALSLFRYDPTLGTVLDLRNVTVGAH